jgi:virulence-associated protein VagC
MPTPEIIARNTLWWSNEVDRLEAVVASLRNDLATYNQVIEALRSGELPWERVQIMETGQLKVLKPAQPALDTCVLDTCIEEVSKDFVKRNGKKDTTVTELVEVTADGD